MIVELSVNFLADRVYCRSKLALFQVSLFLDLSFPSNGLSFLSRALCFPLEDVLFSISLAYLFADGIYGRSVLFFIGECWNRHPEGLFFVRFISVGLFFSY